ncbi:hypothetical protein Ahy_A02g006531 [Arachis hypogaea]|uniref:Aminotransferase-like plant mobile domain-containing protein n=1 Tax=Arachis hypogaea TaxID=3818 RepID=A0A445EA75_ARAHY|nr:hypothetical protein Ahy_A02g006531 [Arachis hypogaea]
MLQCDHYMSPDRYNSIVEGYLRDTGFYHVSQIGVVQLLVDKVQIQRYVKCHIMLLFGTVMFGDKSAAGVHWKFLSLLRNFGGIIQFSWGSACLAHLYRSLCRATRVDCKEIDGPLTLLLAWAWIRLPFIAPIPSNPQIFPIANRYRTLDHYRRDLDVLQEGQWHASDRLRRQLGLAQGVPDQEQDLGEAHGEVLIGPKNQDWSGTHSFWVMHWMNQYSHVLVEHTVPSQHQADIYLHWYRGRYGDHLHLSRIDLENNQHGDPMHDQENQQEQSPPPPSPPQPPPPPSQTQAQEAPEQFTPYIPDTHSADYLTPPVTHIHLTDPFPPTKWPNRVGLLQVDCHWIRDLDSSLPLWDEVADEDEDEDEDEDDDEDEADGEDDDDGSVPTAGTTTGDKGKGYNLRIDPPRRSTSR